MHLSSSLSSFFSSQVKLQALHSENVRTESESVIRNNEQKTNFENEIKNIRYQHEEVNQSNHFTSFFNVNTGSIEMIFFSSVLQLYFRVFTVLLTCCHCFWNILQVDFFVIFKISIFR